MSGYVLALDPDPRGATWVVLDTSASTTAPRVVACQQRATLGEIEGLLARPDIGRVAVEMIEAMGMAVGREVFETCVNIGRIEEQAARAGHVAERITRRSVKLLLCGSMRAKDPNVRQAILDRYGATKAEAIGTKRAPGPLYGVSGDVWAAIGVGLVAIAEL